MRRFVCLYDDEDGIRRLKNVFISREGMEKGFLTTKRRGSSKGVKENNGSVVNAPATVISGMDSGLVSSSVKSTLENLGDIVGKENEGLNSSPIGIASVSYARAMVDLQANIELKDTIMVSVPKLFGEGYNTSTIRVEYEFAPHK
ncbi:hypothetical protein Tco_0179182 [Tanacetum coccineum]